MLLPHIEGDAALIRHQQPDKVNGHLKMRPKHVILAGNGAIEGGTKPLMRAIMDTTSKQISEHAAASVAAVLAQEFKDRKYFALKDLSEILANMDTLDDYFADYYSFKANISKRYSEAFKAGEIRLRASPAFEDHFASISPSETGLVTVNWDHCFWEDSRFENVIQLHGLASDPESIVLPGEFADDDALVEILESLGFSIEDETIRKQALRMFRGDFRRPLTAALQTAGAWLGKAETICVWGLALHAYDSEVCQAAWRTGRNAERGKKITIINPSEGDRAMCKFLFSAPQHELVEFSA